jgi:hypothetical protein
VRTCHQKPNQTQTNQNKKNPYTYYSGKVFQILIFFPSHIIKQCLTKEVVYILCVCVCLSVCLYIHINVLQDHKADTRKGRTPADWDPQQRLESLKDGLKPVCSCCL